MIVFHDYQCQQCGYLHIDVSNDTARPAVRTIPCENAPCEGTAIMLFRRVNSFRHDHPRLYGRPDPQIDPRLVIRDHAHKQRLLREKGLIEAEDPVKGDRERPVQDTLPDPAPPNPHGLPVIEADTLEEIDRQLGSKTQLLE